MESLRHSMPL